MINSNLRCKDNTFSDNMNTFTKIIQKNAEYVYKSHKYPISELIKKTAKNQRKEKGVQVSYTPI